MGKVIIKKAYVKKYFSKQNKDLFYNEIFWLKKFNKYKQIPKIINIDYKNLSLKLSNKGEIINQKNLPKNWKIQLKKIKKILKKNNCLHGDITPNNLVIKNKLISLIDFAQAAEIKNFKEKKTRTFDDDYSFNRISLALNKKDINSNDLRILIIWNPKHEKFIKKKMTIQKKFKVIDRIRLTKNFYRDQIKDRIMWLDSFYNRYLDRKTPKLKNSIICYLILNQNPIFKEEKMIFTNEIRTIDIDIFNFKKNIRKKKKNIIHISDNFEEAKRNALFLSKSKEHYPFKLFSSTQTIHKSLENFFYKINKTKNLKYVLLRSKNYKNDDMDILVNNYHLFKRVADAHSYKLKNLSLISNNGDPFEDYGFKVANYIKIKKNRICLDIRYVGDNYFDNKWQSNILKNKVAKKYFFVPSKKDQLYSILYHIFFHKGYLHHKYVHYLNKNFMTKNFNKYSLKKKINEFLEYNNYKIVRSNDLTITPPFDLSYKQRNTELININIQISKDNFSCANKMLINLIKLNFFSEVIDTKFIKLLLYNNFRFVVTLIKRIILKNIPREKFKF